VSCTDIIEGRDIAQAVSRRLPTAEAWVRSLVSLCGICGEQSGTGAGFSPNTGVPSANSPPSTIIQVYNHYHNPSPIAAIISSGLSPCTPRIPNIKEYSDVSVLHNFQTGCETHRASCLVGTGELFLPGVEIDHSPSSSDEVKNCGPIPSRPLRLHGVVLN
jgi:hypothetical protein